MSYYLGVDVSEADLVAGAACGEHQSKLGRYANNRQGWQRLQSKAVATAQAQGEQSIHLIIEPTGGYERGFVAFAHEQGWQVSLVNPLYVRRFGQGQGARGKSDERDGLMLALYGQQKQPSAQEPLPVAARELQALVARQDDLKKLLRAERNRLKQAEHDPTMSEIVRHSLRRTIKSLEAELAAIDDAIKALLQHSEHLSHAEKLLRSVPGVGQKVVRRLMVLFYRFQALTSRTGTAAQLVAFLGLDPQPYQSGRSVYRPTTISRMGDKLGRADLFMAALGGVRACSPLRDFYQNLLDRGKPKKLALVACSRKILVWAWAVFNSLSPFDPNKAKSHFAP